MARVSTAGAVGLASGGSAAARDCTIWDGRLLGANLFRAGIGCEVWSNEPALTGGPGKGAIRG